MDVHILVLVAILQFTLTVDAQSQGNDFWDFDILMNNIQFIKTTKHFS